MGKRCQSWRQQFAIMDIPSFVTPGTLKANPLFAPVRENPRFQQMIREKQKTVGSLP